MTCREKLKIERPELVSEEQYLVTRKVQEILASIEDGDESNAARYCVNDISVPIILEPEDWTEEEWATILKLFGMKEAERIKFSNYKLEAYGIPVRR